MTDDDRHPYRGALPREPDRDHTGPIPVVPDAETIFGRAGQEYLAELVRAALVTAPPGEYAGRALAPADVTPRPYVAADGGLEVHLNVGEHAYCVRITEV